MKAFFDTSVLVPIFLGEHVHHKASMQVVTGYDRSDSCCAAHSLVETYSVLTRLPARHRVSSDQAMLFIEDLRERLTLVTLSGEAYLTMLHRSASLGIVGATMYDALFAQCALESGAETIYTWNTRNFVQCGTEVVKRLKTP